MNVKMHETLKILYNTICLFINIDCRHCRENAVCPGQLCKGLS